MGKATALVFLVRLGFRGPAPLRVWLCSNEPLSWSPDPLEKSEQITQLLWEWVELVYKCGLVCTLTQQTRKPQFSMVSDLHDLGQVKIIVSDCKKKGDGLCTFLAFALRRTQLIASWATCATPWTGGNLLSKQSIKAAWDYCSPWVEAKWVATGMTNV